MRCLDRGRAGEEVTHRYSWSVERNDKALMNYFFVHPRSPPRLCAADLLGGSIWDEKDTSPPEDDVGSPEGISVSVVHFSKQHNPDLHNRCVWGQASAWEFSCSVTRV